MMYLGVRHVAGLRDKCIEGEQGSPLTGVTAKPGLNITWPAETERAGATAVDGTIVVNQELL
jgi:hypothetical protein